MSKQNLKICFYILTNHQFYSEYDLAQKIDKLDQIVNLDDVKHLDVEGGLSIRYQNRELLGTQYGTNVGGAPSSMHLLAGQKLEKYIFDVTQFPCPMYWMYFEPKKDKILYYIKARGRIINRCWLPLEPFVREWTLCQLRIDRLFGHIGSKDNEQFARNWWNESEVGTKDLPQHLSQRQKEIVGEAAARYVMEADLVELLSGCR